MNSCKSEEDKRQLGQRLMCVIQELDKCITLSNVISVHLFFINFCTVRFILKNNCSRNWAPN